MPRATILSMSPIFLPSMSSLRFCPVLKCRRSWGIIIESAPRITALRVSSITFFELTYVDEGELETEVDGTLYQLKDKELMIYGPGQFHTQYTDDSHNASYMTVLFDMRNLTPVEQEVWYDALINRVFHYDQKINSLIKAFVREKHNRHSLYEQSDALSVD